MNEIELDYWCGADDVEACPDEWLKRVVRGVKAQEMFVVYSLDYFQRTKSFRHIQRVAGFTNDFYETVMKQVERRARHHVWMLEFVFTSDEGCDNQFITVKLKEEYRKAVYNGKW